ncbi:MAG: hypothetical protein RL641_168 [Candidatus Parcubacteria bacterium]
MVFGASFTSAMEKESSLVQDVSVVKDGTSLEQKIMATYYGPNGKCTILYTDGSVASGTYTTNGDLHTRCQPNEGTKLPV